MSATHSLVEPQNAASIQTDSPIERHVSLIRAAQTSLETSFLNLVTAIAAARAELGDDALQKDIAKALGWSPATMSRYASIAACEPVIEKLNELPRTLESLTSIVRIRKLIGEVAPQESEAEKQFSSILKSYTAETPIDRIKKDLLSYEDLKKEKDQKQRESREAQRQSKVLEVSGGRVAEASDASRVMDWGELALSGERFATILMLPSTGEQTALSKEEILSSDIADRWDLAALRMPSQAEAVQGFVYCEARYLAAGMKLLDAAGFKYRDMFVPVRGAEGLTLLNQQKLLLRGERGGSRLNIQPTGTYPISEAGALDIAAKLGEKPRLLLFQTTAEDGWTCAMPPSFVEP